MNSTTWIISPNGLAWGLLIVATLALCLIAVGIMRHSFSKHTESSATQSNRVTHSSNYRTCTTFSIIACLLALVAIGGTFLNVSPTDAGTSISILGTFIAALLGWQVFNAIENVKTLKQLDKLNEELTSQRELIFQKGAESMCLSEAFQMLNSANRKSELITDRYWNCLMAIRQFINGNVEANHVKLHEAIGLASSILDELDKKGDLWLKTFADGEHKWEEIYDSIIRLLNTKAEHLDYLKDRIKATRDKRYSKCSQFRGMTLNEYAEYLRKKKADSTPPTPEH